MNCAGIDVSKAKLDMCIWPIGTVEAYENSDEGIDALVRAVAAANVDLVAVEHTGRFTRKLMNHLNASGISAVFVDPRQVRHFGVAVGQEAKTDRLDARLIARYAALLEPTLRPVTSEEEYTLRYAMVRRRQLVDHRTKEKTRSHEEHPSELADSIARHHAWLDNEIERIETFVRAMVNAQPASKARFDILTTMPGVGDVLAWTLISDLPELGRIDPKPLTQLVGLAPRPLESGTLTKRRRIRGGRFFVRRALYMASLNAARKDERLALFRRRLLDDGKPPMVTRVAVMRKMLLILNAMVRDGKPWNEAS
ncbi:MAG: IS110 family transposase [Pontimonas sp.]